MNKNNKEEVVGKWKILDIKINGVSTRKPIGNIVEVVKKHSIPNLVPQEVVVNGGNSVIYSWDYSSQDRHSSHYFLYNMYHSGSLSLYDRLFNK